MIVILGFYDGNRKVVVVVENIICPLCLSSGNGFSLNLDSPFRE